jgi:hypothetical protein
MKNGLAGARSQPPTRDSISIRVLVRSPSVFYGQLVTANLTKAEPTLMRQAKPDGPSTCGRAASRPEPSRSAPVILWMFSNW